MSESATGFSSEEPTWLAEDRASSGEPVIAPPAAAAVSDGVVSKASIADIEEAMKDVVDPELGINVVDLGLKI